ncbi:MAG TPA: RNA 2',3'-cyclic phosphodiesterase [Clostridiaceae bacterium]|nr:RNA 2',3'-cyclic phosphodiesterase [Clostridiaceae bacterium]
MERGDGSIRTVPMLPDMRFNMRLFIAINFDNNTKTCLYNIGQKLKELSVKGNYTLWENYHLTVVFIGETSKVNDIKQAMDSIDAPRFNLDLKGFGSFHRTGGDIFWIGVEENKNLVKIYSQICDELVMRGINVEKREYKPHITLGREIVLKYGFDRKEFSKSINPITIQVDKISLMKSERINGKLTYTEIYSKALDFPY